MTKEELKTFLGLNDKFIEDCNRVCGILSGSKKRHGECENISYAERFNIEDSSVCWEGDEYWSYGGHEKHCDYFDIEFLTMSDEELLEIVKKENEEYDRKEEQKKKEREEREKAKRFAEYERLKKEFGRNDWIV